MFKNNRLLNPHRQLGSVCCGLCSPDGCLVITEITVVQTAKERSSKDMRNGRYVGAMKRTALVCPGLIVSSKSYLGNENMLHMEIRKKLHG